VEFSPEGRQDKNPSAKCQTLKLWGEAEDESTAMKLINSCNRTRATFLRNVMAQDRRKFIAKEIREEDRQVC
jgi:hypothetical protein